MKKTRMDKGITLVALIITVVILLILAAVAIASIQNEGILEHANTAVQKDTASKEKEIIELARAEAKLDLSNTKYLEKVKAILSKNNDVEKITDCGNKIVVTFKKSQKSYSISDEGKVYNVTEKTLELPSIGIIIYTDGMTWKEWIDSEYNTMGIYEELTYGFGHSYVMSVKRPNAGCLMIQLDDIDVCFAVGVDMKIGEVKESYGSDGTYVW